MPTVKKKPAAKPAAKSTRVSVKRDGATLELKGFAAFETTAAFEMISETGDLSTVKCIKLVNCSFAALPDCLAELPAFERLFVVECPVVELPGWVSDKIIAVWIEKCPLRTLPPPSAKLESLNLRSTLIEALPDLAKYTNLSSLYIEDAPLTRLPDDLGDLQLLEEVQVLKCPNLTELPTSICQLAKLKTLEVCNTSLASVPERIGDLTALRRLVLESNRLKAVPDSLCDIEKLHLLWLPHNQLGSLPARIGALQSLQYLSVHHNKLTTLPDSVFELRDFTLDQTQKQFRFHDNPMPAELVESYQARIKAVCRAGRAARKAAREAAPSS